MTNPLRLFYMALWRNFLMLNRYRLNFFFAILTSVLFGFGMLLFTLIFDVSLLERIVGSTNYVAFAILGLSFQGWLGIALWEASGTFQSELDTGQIEYTFSCPFSRYWYIITDVASSSVQETVFFIPMICVGLWLTRETLTALGVILGITATILAIAALAQLGAMFAALVLRYRRVTAIFGFFDLSFQLLTGILIPIQLLPAPLQIIGQSFPQTFGIDLLRYYIMRTKTIMPIEYEWAILLVQLIALSVLARLAVLHLERKAKEQGLHYV